MIVETKNFLLREEDETEVEYIRHVDKETRRGITIDVVTHMYSYFACTCSDADRQYWKQRLHDYMPEFDADKHASLVSQLCADICHNFNGHVSSIDMDMWFGIVVEGVAWLDDDSTEYEKYYISMECDDVTLGLMAVIDVLKKVMDK